MFSMIKDFGIVLAIIFAACAAFVSHVGHAEKRDGVDGQEQALDDCGDDGACVDGVLDAW